MNKKQTIILIVVLALLGVVGVYYYFWFGKVNYLIPGVPYNGIYNLYFEPANSAKFATILDVLGYWGDKRSGGPSDLAQKFPLTENLSLPDIKKFFEDNGYETYQWYSAEPADEIKEIKKFVNPQEKVPVIVYQRIHHDKDSIFVTRLVIGVFDKEKKVVVHDYAFGNNYEISYGDFEKMSQTRTRRTILAVWPSDKIKGLIEGPNYNVPYPERLEAMDKVGNIVATKLMPAIIARRVNNFEKANALFQEFTSDPNFQYFPRQFQVIFLSHLTQSFIDIDKPDEAIEIIAEVVMPLNKNLSSAPQGWVIRPIDESAFPYLVLSQAYLKKGQKDLAIANYKKLINLVKINGGKAGQESPLQPRIEALEKELFPKK